MARKSKKISVSQNIFNQPVKQIRSNNIPLNQKYPRTQVLPISQKQIRQLRSLGSSNNLLMEWDNNFADLDGVWSWGIKRDWGEHNWKNTLMPFLSEMEKLYWCDIKTQTASGHKKHHSMDLDSIVKEAQERLVEIKQDDNDKLFRFRISGTKRLWGVIHGPRFYILWYDPTHQIYPTEKRHT